jgi:hypothetical protein
MEGKHPGGRPPKYKTKEEMQKKIDKYFEQCDRMNEPYTVTGLALALDLDRKALINYGENEEFSNTLKKAKLKVENWLEKNLITGQGNATGIIFNLKNNYGYKDKQEIDANVNTDIKVTLTDD